jgi:hypothetical protein
VTSAHTRPSPAPLRNAGVQRLLPAGRVDSSTASVDGASARASHSDSYAESEEE